MSEMRVIRRGYIVFEEAAQLVGLLAAVERAYLLEDAEQLDTLLSQVTEAQCTGLADDLRFFALVGREQQAAAREELHAEIRNRPLPPATGAGEPHDETALVALAPVVPLHEYSRRVT